MPVQRSTTLNSINSENVLDVHPVTRLDSFRARNAYFLSLKLSDLKSVRALKLSRLEHILTLKC